VGGRAQGFQHVGDDGGEGEGGTGKIIPAALDEARQIIDALKRRQR
jgi:hypothetical protein